MKLDPETGTVEMRTGLVLNAATRRLDVTARSDEHTTYANGWGWEYFTEQEGEEFWRVGASFDPDGALSLVNLALVETLEIQSWDNWTEQGELLRRDRHDEWLAGQLGAGWAEERYDGASTGHGAHFAWGVVGSDYDQRSGGSSITVRYREPS